MTWDELRDACLALPGAEETFPFDAGITSVFKAPNGKMFALGAESDGPLEISVKIVPEEGVALRGAYDAVREGYHLNKRHWVTLTLGSDLPDDLVVGLVEKSYELVTSRPRARR